MLHLKMLFFIIFLYSCSISDMVSAQECIVPGDVYAEISDCVLSCRYSDAEKVLDRFITAYPDEPAGYLLKAAVLQYECTDYEDFSRGNEFFELIENAEEYSRKKIAANDNDLWASYFLSAAESLKGVWSVACGRFIVGLVQGRSGAKKMLDIVSVDSTFYDAYLMLGSYRFWKSVALSRLPFIDTDRTDAIADVKMAVKRGKLTGTLSHTVLIEMLLDDDPALAIKIGREMIEAYPLCRLFAWQLGEAYKKTERFDDAVRVFTNIADSMSRDEWDDGSGELRCWWKLAVLSKSVGKKEECLYYCKKVVLIGETETVKQRQRKRIDSALQLIEEIGNE
ncbi:hypothetical protein ACFL1R_05000 [Candidatus Latescibacterota bacterium]